MARHLKLVEAPTDVPPKETLKVAFASSDLHHVDQHFGSAEGFVIYAVGAAGFHLLEAIRFTGPAARDRNEGKLAPRLAAIEGCAILYAEAIGPSAKAQLAAREVRGFCVPTGTRIGTLLKTTQASLNRVFPRHRDPGRFAAMEAEGWIEEERRR